MAKGGRKLSTMNKIPNYRPHEEDMHFVKGPFDNQKLRVRPQFRGMEVSMPYGDKLAIYRHTTIRGTPCYEFVQYCANDGQ